MKALFAIVAGLGVGAASWYLLQGKVNREPTDTEFVTNRVKANVNSALALGAGAVTTALIARRAGCRR
ncbi:MAG: hypothetical protein Q8S13_10580 [Dehalococcoidia bacterium]|nr:hypothetical protein [Dehalococcoidia bacterium]